jgi:hypothetical protein
MCQTKSGKYERVSELLNLSPEIELRSHSTLGRAIYVIRETLPKFFTSGLITSIDETTGSPHPSPSTSNPSGNTNFLEHYVVENIDECIYSPNIRLSYTPPVALPAPFPKTLHVEGYLRCPLTLMCINSQHPIRLPTISRLCRFRETYHERDLLGPHRHYP